MTTIATVAAIGPAAAIPSPRPFLDVFAALLVAGAAAAAVVGSGAAWTDSGRLLWGAALAMTGVALAAVATVGFAFAPAAACLLSAALVSGAVGVPPATRDEPT